MSALPMLRIITNRNIRRQDIEGRGGFVASGVTQTRRADTTRRALAGILVG